MGETFKIGMAELKVTRCPNNITTLGLGSCIGITLYDSISKIVGMVHIMLPYSTQIRNNSNKAKFADTGIVELLRIMEAEGAYKRKIIAKIAGGAQMFSFTQQNDIMKIGQRNAATTKEVLKSLSIPVLAEDTGGNYGRTIEINSESGILTVKTIGHGIKYL